MPAPEIIHRLVTQFEENQDLFHKGKINEAQLRLEFLDPFLEAIGWDVYNKRGYSPDYCEVVTEDSLDIEGAAKAPDYAFRIGKERKFFVEAKKPAVNIQYDIHPAYQVRRYAWNAHLPLSILTDFEEFAVYDCRNRPNPTDKASTDRMMFLTYKDYIEKWDEIVAIFSPEAIQKGSFDKYVIGTKGKKGTTEVDDAFLEDIESWRKQLAQNIALRNPQVANERELNFAVQITIDRIIFLRICEDRGIEPEEQLLIAAQKTGIYAELMRIFQNADMKYNSGLFHFKTEVKGDIGMDTITPILKIDDKILKEIIKSIYYPCPYIFKEIPVEILGQVYEQFLGKVIRLTTGHQAKVEEKPEVRKAGGVYYTPKYIVDYIVEKTVGKLLEGKTPTAATNMKIVDPACGSGSFLLGAFQCLIDWHESWYIQDGAEKWARGKNPTLMATSNTGWKLTTSEKKRILLNNLHGVDIDSQAVEVTKLSLLLKVLEEESGQLSLGLERALPDLGKNIQCGNSLIGEDYFEGQLMMDEEEYRIINPFEWKAAFPQVFAQGGFDAVIGNPPYVRQEMLSNKKEYFQSHYRVFNGLADLYFYFIEKGVGLLRQNGLFSFIVANKWMRTNSGETLRKWLRTKCLLEITDFGDLPVFENVTTYPCILRISKNKPNDFFKASSIKNLQFRSLNDSVKENGFDLDQNLFQDKGWSLSQPLSQNVLEKLSINCDTLEIFTKMNIFNGIKTGLNSAFVIDEKTKNILIDKDNKSNEILRPFLVGKDIKRYKSPEILRYLIFMPKGWTLSRFGRTKNNWTIFKDNYPAIAEYLEPYAKEAEKRYDKGDFWWELRACAYYEEFSKIKIIYPNICKQPEFSFDTTGTFTNQKCFIIPTDSKYLLGVLNSKISNFFFRMVLPKLRGGFFEPSYIFLKEFPVRRINLSDPKEKGFQNRIVSLVDRMLDLNKQPQHTPQENEYYKREIAATDRQIDKLVYELYGLTGEEIKIVEGM